MDRAHQALLVEGALGKQRLLVGADAVQRVYGAADVGEHELSTVHLDAEQGALRELSNARYPYELRHFVPPCAAAAHDTMGEDSPRREHRDVATAIGIDTEPLRDIELDMSLDGDPTARRLATCARFTLSRAAPASLIRPGGNPEGSASPQTAANATPGLPLDPWRAWGAFPDLPVAFNRPPGSLDSQVSNSGPPGRGSFPRRRAAANR